MRVIDHDCPPSEIEITPAVLNAGAEQLSLDVVDDLRAGTVTRWSVAEAVFRAMLRVYRATGPT
jgi:hypothetical protein